MGEASCTVERCETAVIALVDGRPHAQEMQDHVDATVCCGKVKGCSCAIILGDEIPISGKYLGELLRIRELDGVVKLCEDDGRVGWKDTSFCNNHVGVSPTQG